MVEYFEIGHISNTHGLKGEVKVRPFTSKMKDYEKLKNILIDFNGELKEYIIESVRYQKDVVLLKLKGIDIIEDAEKIKGKYIKIPREDAKALEEDEYFIADLIGCEVYQDELIGVVEDVFTAGASDVYVIKKVDVEDRKIYVEVPRGLEDDEV